MNKNKRFLLFSILIASLVMGCSSQGSKTYLYTLHPSVIVGEVVERDFEGGLGVGPIVLPEMLNHPEVLVLTLNNQVIANPSYLWAGDLKQALSRVIASNISQWTNSDNVWSFPWDVRTRPLQQVALIVERLAGSLGGDVEFSAKWKILGDKGNTVLSVGRCEFTKTTKNATYDAYVMAINDVINECSKVLVQTLDTPR